MFVEFTVVFATTAFAQSADVKAANSQLGLMRAEALSGEIGGPILFAAGYLSFQFHDPYDADSPARYGMSAAAMGAGLGGLGDGIGTAIARRGLKNAVESGNPAAIEAAQERALRTQGVADVAAGGVMAALSLPMFVWSPFLAENSSEAGNDAIGSGAGLLIGGGAFVGIGLYRLLSPKEEEDLARMPSVFLTTMPGSGDAGIPTLGMTATW